MKQPVGTVLVIDDNVALAQGFAQGLALAGYAVHVAGCADAALRLAIDHQPDAIILDYKMPFVNGVGLLYRLRELTALQQIPVLVITGESLDQEAQRAIQSLKARIREKPISLDDLILETRLMVQCHHYNQSAVEH